MKVLLLTPAPAEVHLGSAETVQRYRRGLQRRGHLCEVLGAATDGQLRQSLEGTIGRFKPDIVHAHDACRTGVDLLGLRLPWVVSMSGEDFYADMVDARRGPLVCEVFRRARRVLVPSERSGRAILDRVPDAVAKIDVVPRAAAALPTEGTDLRRSLGIPRTRFLMLLPGGIRPIKGQLRALPVADLLRRGGIDAELVIVGPPQDPDYSAELARRAGAATSVRVLPSLSRERMGAAYKDADVVLNTSLDEGMSSAILEAGNLARPVVASDVPGNAELIRHRETGLLFGDDDALVKQVLAVARNRSAAGALGLRMREDFRKRFDPEHEIDRLLSAYAAA